MAFLQRFAILAAGILVLGGPALAQTPPNALLTGSMAYAKGAGGSALCAIGGGPSSFKRNGGGTARIAFPEVVYASFIERRNAYILSGTGQLQFNSATAGRVFFDYNADYPADIRQVNFSNYTQSYTVASGALAVAFTMNFRGCFVRVISVFRT